MATIRAFRATRFARLIPEVVAPPYDVITPEHRAELASRSPYNIVHLTLPQDGEARYQHAQTLLNHWLSEGILRTDGEPAIYRYTQQFINPLTHSRETRVGYFVLLHTEPYETGTVLPHEHTFPVFKEDRFRLLEHTRTHLESIFGLFETTPELRQALSEPLWEPIASLEGADLPEGEVHLVERLTDPVKVARIESAFQAVRIWIADGHHRYETALQFGRQFGTDGSPERYLPILLVPFDDPGLVILPTHRLLSMLPPGTPADWHDRLSEAFELRSISREVVPTLQLHPSESWIAFVYPEGAWLIRPKEFPEVPDQPEALTRFDAWWLHHRLMPALGYNQPEVRYTRSVEEALQALREGDAQAVFLLSPPTLATLREVAEAGAKMPQKSTYFYPKVLSGLITWRIGT